MNSTILSVGEIIWDLIGGTEHIGGAPFNVAAHLAQLGHTALFWTRTGNDDRGVRARAELVRLGVDITCAQLDLQHPTGWALARIDDQGIATFELSPDPAHHYLVLDHDTLAFLQQAKLDAICFSTPALEGACTRGSLFSLLTNVQAPIVLYDVNIRGDFYPAEVLRQSLAQSTAVKLNEIECALVARRLYGEALGAEALFLRLVTDFPIEVVCLTLGKEGSIVYTKGRSAHCPAPKVDVCDTIGSGDAFCAGFLSHYASTGDPFEAARRGNLLGAYVAAHPGAVPIHDDVIRASLGRPISV